MGIFDKKDIVKIAQEDLNDAKLSSAVFQDENVRRTAFIDILGARLAMKLLFSKKIEANNLYSLYTIHNVLGQMDLSDIYYNGIKIDVRVVFDRNEMFIPKSHFQNGMLPDLYLIIALNQDLSSTEFLGCIEPKNIDQSLQNDTCYFVEQEALEAPKDLKKYLDDFIVETKPQAVAEDIEKAESLLITLIDGEITNIDKTFLLKQLANNFELREKLVELENFELLAGRAAKDETLASDNVLEIIGAQRLFADAEAAEAAGLELEAEAINLLLRDDDEPKTKGSISETTNEETEAMKNSNNNSFAGTLAEGAVIAGSAAVAGGLLAAGAAAIAQTQATSATVSATTSAVEGLASVGSSIVDNIIKTDKAADKKSFDEQFTDESPIEYYNDEFEVINDSNEIESDIDFLDELSSANAGDENIDFLDELSDIEDSIKELEDIEETAEEFTTTNKLEELEEFETVGEIDELDEIGTVEETEETFEEFTTTDEVEEFETFGELEGINEFEELEELDVLGTFEDTKELEEFHQVDEIETLKTAEDNHITPLEELTELETIAALPELLIEEPEQKDDTVDIDTFDFGMFEEDGVEDKIEHNFTTESFEGGTLSFDDLEDKSTKEAEKETEDMSLQFEEIGDEEIEEIEEEDDMNELSCQVDDLLKDIELSDEQQSLLNEINFELDEEEKQEETFSASSPDFTTNHEPEKESTPELDLDIDLLTATGPIEDDQDLLNALFQKENINMTEASGGQLELGERAKTPSSSAEKRKKTIIAASVAGVMLVSLVAVSLVTNKKEEVTFPASTQNSAIAPELQTPDAQMAIDTANGPSENIMDTGAALGPQPEQQLQPNRDMGKAVSDAFLSEPVTASVSKIAWEVPEDLAYNDSFRKYLQIAGKNLKLTLSNDLLLTNEMAYSNKIIVDLKISKDGAVQASNVVVTSGSKQIDGIVLQSVKETLKYLKMPSAEISGPSVNATLIINF